MIRMVTVVVALLALAMGGAILLAAPGAKFGFWEYGDAFSIYRQIMQPALLKNVPAPPPVFVFGALSLIGAIFALFSRRGGLALFALIAALIAGAGGYVPKKIGALAAAHPVIHDLTTDFENPPLIVAAADMPRKNPAEYVGDAPAPREAEGVTTAAAQMAAYPDIQPIILDAPFKDVVRVVGDVLGAMNMEILAEGPVGDAAASGWRIEAAHTSAWFGFVDDFIVRVRPMQDGKTRVDVRSKSRVGGSDLGANAKRIRSFVEKLNAAV